MWGPGRQLHKARADAALEWVVAWGGGPGCSSVPPPPSPPSPRSRLNLVGLVMLEPAESLADLLSPH